LPFLELYAQRSEVQARCRARLREQLVPLIFHVVFDGASEVSHQLVHRGAGGPGLADLRDQPLRLLVLFLGLGHHIGDTADGLAQRRIEDLLLDPGVDRQLVADPCREGGAVVVRSGVGRVGEARVFDEEVLDRQVNTRARSRPAVPNCSCNDLSLITRSMPEAISSSFRGSKNRAASPATSRSGGMSEHVTGIPAAIASRTGIPNPSKVDG